MLTRCPQCRTVFKVSVGQMKARGGLVRCGCCHTAFDALQMLIEGGEDAGVPVGSGEEHPPVRGSNDDIVRSGAAPVTGQSAALPKPSTPELSTSAPLTSPVPQAPEIVVDTSATANLEPIAADQPPTSKAAVDVAPTVPVHACDAPSGRREPVLAAGPAPDVEAAIVAEPVPATPQPAKMLVEEIVQPPGDALEDFLREPPAPRRWPWVLGSALALLALAVQAAIALRVELAVLYPPSKPLLVELCTAIGCRLELPRHIELVSIEASSLHPGNGGRLELVASLRNRAPFAQQYPYLEVTLTDAADRAVVRRAFAPHEWLPAGQDIDTGFAAQGELAIELALQAQDIAPAGYRLYIFHP